MFSFFKPALPFQDEQLGKLTYKRNRWWGHMTIMPHGEIPIALSGNRQSPHVESLALTRTLPAIYAKVMPGIQKALFKHAEPYLEVEEGAHLKPVVKNDASIWEQVKLLGIAFDINEKQNTANAELHYSTSWDEEHTLAATIQNGKMVDFCGSVPSLFW